MALFTMLSVEEAKGDVAETYADIQTTLKIDFIPNFFQTMGKHAPNVLRGTWEAYKNVNWKGMLPPALKEMVFSAISAAKKCAYCEAAHLAFCSELAVSAENMIALTTDLKKINPEKVRAAVQFGVDCAADPIGIDEQKTDLLIVLGFSKGEVLELIAMVSFSLYAINLADAMKIEIDDDFRQILAKGLPEYQLPLN